MSTRSRHRQHADGILTDDEIAGCELFIGKANCTQCHNGPLFTNNEFHNTGVPARPELPIDDGRLTGAAAVLKDEFNCRSRWSDAREQCAELDFLVTGDHVLERAFKVPSLRNVAERAPYMHAGQFATLERGPRPLQPRAGGAGGHTELKPLGLQPRELRQLEAFLRRTHGSDRCEWRGTSIADAMTRTVDIVIVGANAAAIAATVDAANRGLRVLLVIRPRLASLSLELRQTLRRIRVRRAARLCGIRRRGGVRRRRRCH